MSDYLKRTEIPRGAYPERREPLTGKFSQWARRLQLLAWKTRGHPRFQRGFLDKLAAAGKRNRGRSGDALAREAGDLRRELRTCGLREELVVRSFALVREVAAQVLRQRHYEVQLIGGWGLLHGMACEMETGEGKTLTATLPACTVAMAGLRVHVITVNDYLAARDAELMRPVYDALGLRVGVVIQGTTPAARQEAYACDVTYATSKEVAFDYLRDKLTLGRDSSRLHLRLERLSGAPVRESRLLLQGLEFGIVDELDSVLIDEARTPLIISAPEGSSGEREAYRRAFQLAADLQAERHFRVESLERRVMLTDAGRTRLCDLIRTSGGSGGIWSRTQSRESIVLQALTAKHLFAKDQQYIVRAGKVQIVDENTGRALPDRAWEDGLHQAIETKEGCALTPRKRPVARITYQRFFRRYLHLAGMTGTAREVSGELAAVYGLAVLEVPTNRPLRRHRQPFRVYFTAVEKWRAIVERTKALHNSGRAVLIGTRSVAASEHVSQLLTAADLSHRVLNARQDREEANTILQAGKPGSITVATNMAGRGTDIRLAPAVAERGGLHVIATELHEAGRIDRQLFGRCGRQGDSGSYEAILSLEDELIQTYAPKLRSALVTKPSRQGEPVTPWIAESLLRYAQRVAESRDRRVRRDLACMDDSMESILAFSGATE